MISKEQFLELKHLKSLGVPTTTIAKKIGISVPNANKWLRMDEDAFETHLIDNTPYLEQYRVFILNILKICPQTQATNIMYRVKDQFPDFNCRKTTFFRYIHDLREQTGYVKPEERPTSFREDTPPGYEAQVDFGQFKIYLEKNSDNCSHLAFGDAQISTTFLRERIWWRRGFLRRRIRSFSLRKKVNRLPLRVEFSTSKAGSGTIHA